MSKYEYNIELPKIIEQAIGHSSKESTHEAINTPPPSAAADTSKIAVDADPDRLERLENMIKGMQAYVQEIHSVRFTIQGVQTEMRRLGESR